MILSLKDRIIKYRFILIAECLGLCILAFFLVIRKAYSFTLTPDMLVFTEEGLESGYVSATDSGLLKVSVPADADPDGLQVALWCTDIPAGIYKADISYSASYDTSVDNKPVVKIITFDETGDVNRFSDDAYLYDHVTQIRSRIYMGKNAGPFYSFFVLYGAGDTVIESVTVSEYMPARLLVFLVVFVFLILFDLLIMYLPSLGKEKTMTLVLLTVLTVIVSLPFFAGSAMHGHDVGFHMYRVGALGESIRNGQFPVRYMPGAYYGHGYIIDIFYANIFLLPSALLYMLGLPLYAAYNSFLFFISVATVIIAYISFKGVFGSSKWGVTGAYMYAFSMYRLCNVYVRSDAGELSAMAFLPLVIYGLYRIYTSEKRDLKNCIPFMVAAFGLVQSHILTVLLCIFFIVIFALAFIKKTVKKLPELLFSAGALLILNLFYLVPVFSSFMGMGMSTGRAAVADTEKSALIISRILDFCVTYREPDKTVLLYNDMLFSPGPVALVCLVLFAAMAAFILIRRKNTDKTVLKTGMVCFGLCIVAAFISSAAFPWEKIIETGGVMSFFTSMQFPWRFMEVADPLACFAAVSGLVLIEKSGIRTAVLGGSLAIVMVALTVTGLVYADSYMDLNSEYGWNTRDNFTAIRPDWTYFPEGLNRYLSQDTGAKTAGGEYITHYLKGEGADSPVIGYEVLTCRDSVKQFRLVNGEMNTVVTLPVFALDNIRVLDGDGREIIHGRSADCKVTVRVPSGTDTVITVKYMVPVLWKICDLISLLGLVTLVAFFSKNSKKSQKM